MSKGILRIGHLSTFYHTAILLSGKSNLGLEMEVEASWRLFGTGPSIIGAFERGELDIAYIGLPPAIIGIDRGVPIKCIAGGHTEGTVIVGKKGSLSCNEAEGLEKVFGQFRGKRIGVPGKGSIHDVIFAYLARKHRLENELQVVNFRWADEIVEEMAAGKIQAAFGTPSLAVSAQRYAEAILLCPASFLWPDNPSYGIVAHTDFIQSNEKIIENFLRLHEQANEFIRTEPMRAAEAVATTVGVVDNDFILDVFKVSPRYCSQLSKSYITSTMEFVNAMVDLGYIQDTLSESRIFDTTLIRRVHPPGDHYGSGIKI
jgi:NitT/TauT family transport system substrate-binding protein